MRKTVTWAIIGGGNGGQSVAGHLALMGYPVRLYDIFRRTVDIINDQGGIKVDGVVQGFGALQFATTDLGKAIKGADAVMIIAPATAHRVIARDCSPHLEDGQVIILHPGATCGALEFREELDASGCRARLPIAETNSLIYACRSPQPGQADILGIKDDLVLATLPASDMRGLEMLQEAFPQIKGGKNVMETSLGNANAIMHPAPSILNLSMIESRHKWFYYVEGITPTIGSFVEDLDRERLALAKSFGIELSPILEWYRVAYGVEAATLSEACRKNPAYQKIAGQKEFKTRYIMEDVPFSMLPMIEIGKLQGVAMHRMELIAGIAQYLVREDSFIPGGRTLKNLGLAGMSRDQFAEYIQTGKR
jgi:opine dehydrogenase